MLEENRNIRRNLRMADYMSGVDALNALNEEGGGSGAEFTSFKSGTTFKVKVLGTADLISFFSYGIFKKVNSFVAANPSKKSAKGYPVENLTPWDKAWKYHKDLSKDFSDQHGMEAGKYRCKQRFAVGFFDLTSGEQIVVDVSKPQAQAIFTAIKKYEKKLGKIAFELTKSGSGTSTTVSLNPLIDMDEDLTDAERANFDKAPAEFDKKLFDGLLYELDDNAMVDALVQAGFDVSLIGLDAEKRGGNEDVKPIEGIGSGENGELTDDDLPF
jgi:hypothetical protein